MRVIDLREDAVLPEKLRRHFPHAETRRFQADLAIQLYDHLSNNYRGIIVEGPTGLGKRVCGA